MKYKVNNKHFDCYNDAMSYRIKLSQTLQEDFTKQVKQTYPQATEEQQTKVINRLLECALIDYEIILLE